MTTEADCITPEEPEEPADEKVRAELIRVRVAFGLGTSELAEILQMDRQDLILHFDKGREQDADRRKKLERLVTLADEWNGLCRLPAWKLLHIRPETKSLFEALCGDPPDTEETRQLMRIIAGYINDLEARRQVVQKQDNLQSIPKENSALFNLVPCITFPEDTE
jgi:hypothetical protein